MKMSSAFDLPLSYSDYSGLESKGWKIVHSNEIGKDEAEAIAVAVNNHDKLVETLNNLLNDCINFSDDAWCDSSMEQASDLLKEIRDE